MTLSCLLIVSVASAVSYPKVDPESVFPEIKIYDKLGRPYRSAREDWEGARKRIEQDPLWAQWLNQERATVDAWMKRHRDRVTWIAGWSNNFVSPKDGSKLTWIEAIPGEEVDHFSSPSDPHVEITDKLMAAWVRTWREHHAEMMERAARLYRLTNEEKYAEWAADQLDFYANHYLEWEPQRQGARLFWQSLTEGVNLITYAQTVRLLGEYAGPSRRKIWHDDFFVPEVAVLNENFPKILNITCWLRGAAAQVALVFDDDAMWQEAINGPFGVRQQVSEGITSDYLWFEQSLGYNSYVVTALTSLFETAGLFGRADELALEMATVENLMLASTYLRFPTGQLPTPSDTKGQLFAPDREFIGSHYRVFPTTIGLADVQKERNWDTLLDPPSPLTNSQAELPEVTSRNFETSRMAVLKKGPWQVFFHYGQPPIKSHLQAEVLNYSAFYGDVDITHDPGTVGYGSPLHKYYYTQGLNHNVPLVNGEGQQQPPKGRKPDPFTETRAGELIDFSINPPTINAAHPVYRTDAAAERELRIEGESLIDVTQIEVQSSKPQKLGLALHVQGSVRLPDSFLPDPDFSNDRPPAFSYWKNVSTAEYENEASFDVDFKTITMRITFSVASSAGPSTFRVWHGSSPDMPPGRREAFYLETAGTSATFTTRFAPVGDIATTESDQ
ncbi:heparinase II/III domain-containing protein [Bythopirellula polymerisocia]|uniref:heparinase II/III domain-containing protein n=1 Tax=Bythopirellula polymerisocia TaxID=2528003 RepID=UPI0011B5191B|nr:heparinase II/III family protein [Bythopirellula polymerisocia]